MSHCVTELKRFDVYRDGGSISVSYLANDGNEYTLFFKVDLSSKDRENNKIKYRTASLVKYQNIDYISHIIGMFIPDWKQDVQDVSWEEAVHILQEIEPLQQSLATDYGWVFESMLKVANSEDHSVEHS